ARRGDRDQLPSGETGHRLALGPGAPQARDAGVDQPGRARDGGPRGYPLRGRDGPEGAASIPAGRQLPLRGRSRAMAEAGVEKKRMREVLRILHRAYPEAECSLTYQDPFQLLVATILS